MSILHHSIFVVQARDHTSTIKPSPSLKSASVQVIFWRTLVCNLCLLVLVHLPSALPAAFSRCSQRHIVGVQGNVCEAWLDYLINGRAFTPLLQKQFFDCPLYKPPNQPHSVFTSSHHGNCHRFLLRYNRHFALMVAHLSLKTLP